MIRLINGIKSHRHLNQHLFKNFNVFCPQIRAQLLHTGNNKKIYTDAKIETSDDELMNKIVIKNFKNTKDESPNVIDIDNETGEVRQISKDHDSVNIKNVTQ